MKQYAQRDFNKYLHYYIFPKWSAGRRFTILFFASISCIAGLAGAGLSHMNIQQATLVWHIAMVTTITCLIYYVKGLYEVYMAYGWDINY